MISVRRHPRRLVTALAAAAALAAGTTAAASTADSPDHHGITTVFVSPWGNDHATGTNPGRAVHSLQRAQQIVRSLNSAMTGDIRVELADGTYSLSQPLALDARDSGTNGHTVTWTMQISKPMPLTLSCRATVTGDTLEGKVKAGIFGSFPIAGIRA